MKKEWPKRYRTIGAMAAALRDGEIPASVLSPGGAADALGVTRQAIHDRIKRGTLRAWLTDDGYILVDAREVRSEAKKKQGIAETQGELLNVST